MSKTSTWVRGRNPNLKLAYHCHYDYDRAEWVEWYTLHRRHLTLFRKREVWKPVMTGAGEFSFPVRGDLKWAKKIAKEFDVERPKTRLGK